MIYFAQPTIGGPVKIGYSGDVPARVRQLEAHYGQPLAVLATIEGGYEEEQAIHARFAHLRLDGGGRRGVQPEQFRPAPDLMAFIGRPLLVGANPEAVELMTLNPNRRTTSMRLDDDAHQLARQACGFTGESLVEYISRVVREQAEKDVRAGAEKFLRESTRKGKKADQEGKE